MPALEPTNYHPLPDDPWRASDHNALVDQSAEIEQTFTHQHGDAGDHKELQFPVAGASIALVGGVWSIVHSHGIASLTSISPERIEIVLERPMQSASSWGVIGTADNNGWIDIVTIGKTRDTCTIRIKGGLRVAFCVVGPHEPL